jgi:DNA polymerase-4
MSVADWPAFCRDCLSNIRLSDASGADNDVADTPCPTCGSTKIVAHPELNSLTIAHLDCDAFYAAIEKRDDPSLKDKPLIVGGETRGVVSTACYIARKYGVRSAMPMFEAKKLCPQAAILKPRHAYYAAVARQIRALMQDLTPLVEPLSLDEAYLDLSGTDLIHGMSPARTMAKLARQIERDIGISVSIGLSGNKFLAKLASEIDKPRGFAVIGMKEAVFFLRDKKIGIIRGAGKVLVNQLARDGFVTIGDLQNTDQGDLANRYGATGLWLARIACAQDSRPVDPGDEMKSISSETTFEKDLGRYADLEAVLWRQAERVSARAKSKGLCGRTVVLKLKTASFKLKTRSTSLNTPTQLADRIFRTAQTVLKREADGTKFRLLGVGITNLAPSSQADPANLIDPQSDKRAAAEHAMDLIRAKFGGDAVGKGRGMRQKR